MKPIIIFNKKTLVHTSILVGFLSVGLLGGCGLVSQGEPTEVSEPTPSLDVETNNDNPLVEFNSIPSNIRFTKIDSDDGLLQSTTYAIIQDTLGFMWFGTEDGLNRYDGYNFTLFQPISDDPTSLSDRWVTSMITDGNGNLWIGTRQGGLNYYDAKTGLFTQYLHDNDVPGSLSGNSVTVLLKDRLGRLWVGTNLGLDLLEKDAGTFKHYSFDFAEEEQVNSVRITSLYEDSKDRLWIGTNKSGMYRLIPSTDTFMRYKHDATDQKSISSNNVKGILPAGDSSLWIATDSGLDLFIQATENFTHYEHDEDNLKSLSNDQIRTMTKDHSGNLWIGTGTGLDYFDIDGNEFIHFSHDALDPKSLSSNSILAIYESEDNVLWVSTYGGYINKYNRGMDRFAYYHNNSQTPRSLAGNIIFKIFVDQFNYVWIATIDGGLNRLNPISDNFITFKHSPSDEYSLASNEVWSVYKDSLGVLWVGTSAGLDRLDPNETKFFHYANSENSDEANIGLVYDMVEDKYNNLWLGTDNGLYQYNRINDSFTRYLYDSKNPYGISDSIVEKVYIDNSENLWIGTYSGGLNRYDRFNDQFAQYKNDPEDSTSLSNDMVLTIYQDHSSRLWVGTDGGGLNLFDPSTDSFMHYTEKDGLPSNVIYGILEDEEGNLWLSTNRGISCFDPGDITFVNFNESDGLQGNEFNMNAYAQSDDGVMYFGGVNGLTSFKPNDIYPSEYVPKVVLLSTTQNGMEIPIKTNNNGQQQITLNWPYNSFEFSFASLSYADPSKNQHAYQLEGFDPDWINAGSWRDGRYTNLPGGIYTLRIKGSNEDGVWNEEGNSLLVRVVPAFWQTLWFQISASLLVLGTVIVVYRLRNENVKANTRELERQVNERTKEIEGLFEKTKELAVIEERNRLARELHDSAKQKAFAALAQLGTAGGILPNNPVSARAHLEEAENLVYEVIEELTFLIQEMYPLALKEKGLANSLRDYVFDWEARTDIQVKLLIEKEKRLTLDMEQAIYRAIQEALSNIARHSKATSVKISLDFHEQEIAAEICDNGCGFDPKTRLSGMGLRTIRERIEALGGNVKIESAPEHGTCLSLNAPIKAYQNREGDPNDEPNLNNTGG